MRAIIFLYLKIEKVKFLEDEESLIGLDGCHYLKNPPFSVVYRKGVYR